MPAKLSEPLSSRELEVLSALREGHQNKGIARALDLSEATVKFHLKNIYTKLGASGRFHALVLSQDGVFPEPEMPSPEALRRQMEPALSPLALLERTRRLHGDREAVVDGGRRFTYHEFFDRCTRGAEALRGLGLSPGDRVATVAVNSHTHIEQFFAVPMAGGVIVPVNHRLSGEEIANVIQHCGARMVLVSREFLPTLERIRPNLSGVAHFVNLDGPWSGWHDHERLISKVQGRRPYALPDENDLLAINYTSGTVQDPRGVMVSQRNAWINAIGCLLHWPIQPHDRYLWLLPLSHGNGWGFVWTVTAAGATHICSRDGSTDSLIGQIIRDRVSILCAGRSALLGIASLPDATVSQLPRGIRVLTAGGSPSVATLERIEARLGWAVSHAYGLTETAVFVAFRGPSPEGAELQSPEARARWNVLQGADLLTSGEVRVVDEEGTDVPHDGHTMGEVVTRGPSLMLGYYKDPEATRRAFVGGWFHTGDAGVIHTDGALEVRDRIKDIIISNDQLVAPIDVENVLSEHPNVQDVAVVGRQDPILGEAIHAFVVPRSGTGLTVAELGRLASEKLTAFKRPHQIHLLEQLPRTGSGKVIKRKLREAGTYPTE